MGAKDIGGWDGLSGTDFFKERDDKSPEGYSLTPRIYRPDIEKWTKGTSEYDIDALAEASGEAQRDKLEIGSDAKSKDAQEEVYDPGKHVNRSSSPTDHAIGSYNLTGPNASKSDQKALESIASHATWPKVAETKNQMLEDYESGAQESIGNN